MWRRLVVTGIVLAAALVGVYVGVPQIQPCALLARVLPAALLPRNPNVANPAFEALPGARAIFGECACSGYRIEVPEHWNGDLMVYAHGFRGAAPTLTVTDLPVRQAAIEHGMAWAASSYRANGFNPQDGVKDTLILIEQFKKKAGMPKRIFIYGSSMGGHVVVASLEQHPQVYAGGFAECGAVSGAGQLDYLLSLNTAADHLAGIDMFDREHKGLKAQLGLLNQFVYPALGKRPSFTFDENRLTGQFEPPPEIHLTAKGEAFRNIAIHLSGGKRPFAEEGFAAAYGLSLESVRALYGLLPWGPVKAGSNASTVYQIDSGFGFSSEALNAEIPRITSAPAVRSQFTFTGELTRPLLTMDDTGDMFVPMANGQAYRKLVESAGKGDLLVQRTVRRFVHCDFSIAERNQSFNDLIAWVNGGAKPGGEDLMGPLEDVGRRWTSPRRPDDPGHP
jgi:pimeloyl-ACP methyl ester carboxylesterase